ncbi:MAG: hypothetical protein WCO21_03230 [bacterium]|nr:hypothetical protein [Candidatus Jorgensenbacteria bacterium]
MHKDYQKLFESFEPVEPPEQLFHDTMLRIDAKKRRVAMYARIGFFGVTSATALLVLAPIWNGFYVELTQSGFSQLSSLIFSDGGTIMTYWQDFILSLAESLPILSAIGLVGSVLLFLVSTERLIRNVRALTRSNLVAF